MVPAENTSSTIVTSLDYIVRESKFLMFPLFSNSTNHVYTSKFCQLFHIL